MTPQAPAAAAVHPTTQRQLDEAVARLREAAPAFARLPPPDRIALARSMQSGFVQVAEQLVHAACAAKGLPTGTPLEAQEWATGPWPVIRQLRLTAESLASLQHTGNTTIGPVSQSADGRLSVRVFPTNGIDGVLFGGTILGLGERHTRPARLFLKGANKMGDFDNPGDTADGLREILEASFRDVEVEVVGSAAMFTARNPRPAP